MSISRHLDEYVERRSITISDAVVPERCQEFSGEIAGQRCAGQKRAGQDTASLEDAAARVARIMWQ